MTKPLTTHDHYTILRWANAHGGDPARLRRAKDQERGPLTIAFPQHDRREHFEPISWDEFFSSFEAEQLELTYEAPSRKCDPMRRPFSTLLPRIASPRARARDFEPAATPHRGAALLAHAWK